MARKNTIMRSGSRFYVDETGFRYPGVTSIIDMEPKPYLKAWGQKLVAEFAVKHLAKWVGLGVDPDTHSAAIDMLKKAPDRFTSEAADVGTLAHEAFEVLAAGDEPTGIRSDVRIFVEQFKDFLRVVKPELVAAELTVVSKKHIYAGSFDAILIIDGLRLLIDYKTTRSGVHESVAYQLAAYDRADHLMKADGTLEPWKSGVDGAAVVHVRPEGWAVHPVPINDEVFDQFLAYRHTFSTEREGLKTAIARQISRVQYSGSVEEK